MCGIVGYIGGEQAAPFLLSGLQKLEYRGYDSAGVAVYNGTGLHVVKSKGRLSVLDGILQGGEKLPGVVGIGHTRWATHGAPSDVNSHPQVSDGGKFAVVHNGIIENYLELKNHLLRRGIEFVSDTDTEVVAQLLEYYYRGDVLEAISRVTARVEGSYALGIICADCPEKVFAVRKDSPLIVGLGQGENFIASDIPAILSKTRDICRLYDREIAVLEKDGVQFFNSDMELVEKPVERVQWDVAAAEKGGYEHFMMKEICEQPEALRKTISPRIREGKIVLDDMRLTRGQIEKINKVFIVACGTSYHVGVVAKYAFEKLLKVPMEVDVASEFRYRDPILDENTLVIIISQSGETADTLAALREAKKRGARVLSIVNVVGSTIANESDDVLYTWAGPEIAVASTKAYSTQLAVIYLIVLYMAQELGHTPQAEMEAYLEDLQRLPDLAAACLADKKTIQYFASKYFNARDMYFIGRNVDYAASLEASLKLKEISYIHSEAYTGGELKHGPISLLEDGTLVIAICTYGRLFDKMMSNVREVKARGAVVLGITTRDKEESLSQQTDYQFCIPKITDFMLPSLSIIPLQLFAYYVASMKGCDIDKPRNLAKSVTVE
ncbi:glutamine--fructose-6-phosphate transaminase (isomerizing) [Neglecta sp. X4]|uniref:glutamine--fructose-6-phosphate transaminase (isomerizing) n=1 Tax=unclassified Neglectibacter TaxID=2632164 RepID=UPI00136A2286|nr:MULTISPECIES: glutamine--fructose-6-phosphate transaminase (isomerizing) [unclassified Neglectibacter]NBI16955.1 glutamine--fructose-6-phosphate transaminase (isomerizing) [Neglectibacter sp. 59]NBJ72367.1 glutamine--fructose-6-phosphate transaminase (isomerizing) [Neglectibacter sp. X4]NCE80142.1 glutamine--fructose-6-phosphate transaminase (isomerizing) [Neglectibacter sp. X58]